MDTVTCLSVDLVVSAYLVASVIWTSFSLWRVDFKFGFPPGFGPCGSRLTFCNFLAFDLSLIFLVVYFGVGRPSFGGVPFLGLFLFSLFHNRAFFSVYHFC